MIYLITGGVRSGKSSYAEALANYLAGEEVLYIATLSAEDDEMKRRINQHKKQRPNEWETLEEPLDVGIAIANAKQKILLLDCLSGWVSNLVLKHEDSGEEGVMKAVSDASTTLVASLSEGQSDIIVVTNEVGYGVVPPYALGRWFRDALGSSNQKIAKASDNVGLMTVGYLQTLKGSFPEFSQSTLEE